MTITVYSAEDIHRVVNSVGLDTLMDEAIGRLTQSLINHDERNYRIPARDGFEYSSPDIGLIEWMPAMQSGGDVAIKIVGYHPANPKSHSVPTILSAAVTFDTTTGRMLSLIDGTFLTALRTGAASAVASRVLASPGSRILGLIGAGAQAISQLHALSRVFKIEKVLVFDSDEQVACSFIERAKCLNLRHMDLVTASLEKTLSDSHIICTATSIETGEGPVFQDENLKTCVHINAVGSDFPGKFEIPHPLLQRSLVCPDFLVQATREGECQQLRPDEIGPSLVELVADPTRYVEYRNRTTVFDSTGWALEDYVIVEMLLEHGKTLGCGTKISLTDLSADPRNPYSFIDSKEITEQDTRTVQLIDAR